MAFDRNAFIADAKEQGYDTDSINAFLTSRGEKPIGKVEEFMESGNLSKITAGIGGVGGGLALGIPGAAMGGTGGYAAGKNVEDIYKIIKGTYKKDANMGEAISRGISNIGEAGTAGMVTGGVWSLPLLLKTLLSPLETTKKISAGVRTKSIGGKTVPSDLAQSESLARMKANKYYQVAPSETQSNAQAGLSRFFNEVNPPQTMNPSPGGYAGGQSMIQQPPATSINKMYEYLPPYEQMGKAYTQSGEPGGTAMGQGTGLASRAIREYLTTQIPKTAQIANQVYGTTAKIQPMAQKVALGTGLSYLIWRLLPKIAGQLGISDK